MPVDPSISTNIAVPKPPASLMADPFGTLSTFADIQNKQNTAKLFNYQMLANQEFGRIMAGAPDVETGLDAATKSQYGALLAEPINAYRGAMLALTQQQGEVAKQTATPIATVAQNLGVVAGAKDMATARRVFDQMSQAALAVATPQSKGIVRQALDSYRESLFDGQPMIGNDPATMEAFRQQAISRWATMGGGTPAALAMIVGQPAEVGTGGGTQLGQRNLQTGGFAPTAFVPHTLDTQIVDVPRPEGGTTKTIIPAGGAPQITRESVDAARAQNALGAQPPGQVLGTTPTTTQATLQGETGKTAGSMQQQFADFYTSGIGQQLALQYDLLGKAMAESATGGFQGSRATLAQIAQGFARLGFDISPETINKIAGGDIAAAQEIKKSLTTFNASALAQTVKGQALASEANAFMSMLDENLDPSAVQSMVNNARTQLQTTKHQADLYPIFAAAVRDHDPSVKNYNEAQFGQWYDKVGSKMPLPTEMYGTSIAPRNDAKSATQGPQLPPGYTITPLP